VLREQRRRHRHQWRSHQRRRHQRLPLSCRCEDRRGSVGVSGGGLHGGLAAPASPGTEWDNACSCVQSATCCAPARLQRRLPPDDAQLRCSLIGHMLHGWHGCATRGPAAHCIFIYLCTY
jgi:hypothetical protein